MYWFRDNWYGDIYEYPTLREAKKEARKRTYGHVIFIHAKGQIVAKIEPRENPPA